MKKVKAKNNKSKRASCKNASLTKRLEEKRKKRRKQTAEIFTPQELVNDALDSVAECSPEVFYDPTKTCLDPACGNGNFLVSILWRKLKNGHNSLQAIKTIHGIDIMRDNIRECRLRLLKVINIFGPVKKDHIKVVFQNIVCLSKSKYPRGTLDYDMSFSRKATPEEVDRWMKNIKKGALETVELPDFK